MNNSQSHQLDGIRVCLVARHFPPLVSGGVRRTLTLALAMEEMGAIVTIVSPTATKNFKSIHVFHPQPEPTTDHSPAKLSVCVRIKNWIRIHRFLPDPDIRWARTATKKILKSNQKFDVIITSSPAESMHFVGYKLAKEKQILWVSDFRDHWLEQPLLTIRRNALRAKLERIIARRWLRYSQIKIAVSRNIADEIEHMTKSRAHVIPQAIRQVKAGTKLLSGATDENLIHVGYTGSFMLSDPERKIAGLLDVFSEALSRNPNLRLHLVGRLTILETAYLDNVTYRDKIQFHGVLSYEETIQFQSKMSGLIATSAENSNVIPGKFFEYKQTGIPIICIGGVSLLKANFQTDDPALLLANLTNSHDFKPQKVYDTRDCGKDLSALIVATLEE